MLFCLPIVAQQAPQPSTANQAATVQSAPPRTIAYTLPPDKLEKARALYTLRTRLWLAGTVYSLLILLGLLYSGVAARYRDWAQAISCWRFLQAPVFVPLTLLTIALLELPLSIYQHHISLQYGLSVQAW